ncbi:DnaJ domain-containing protein [Exiguobacterium marinum]|uniref:DnaJ domain-containing protein n=1 Tax=Exiguobacterium marinum TaxID=273528 RepID=A0ABY7WWW0_9BACL|nr:DnaJ domain-containing protein [Exiguobacterium marinum]WDH75352.1 DnaJ domain-containing protein [Exiguobacterium marinum]
MMNYYELLGVEKHASKEEIKRAYVINSQYSENNVSNEMKKALLILTDPLSRIQYDRTLISEQLPSHLQSLQDLKAMNYYDRLNVSTYANQDTIKQSYYDQVKVYSNEVYPDHFILIREAYEVLSNPTERKKYSTQLHQEQTIHSSVNETPQPLPKPDPPIGLAQLREMNYFERLDMDPYASQEKMKEHYYQQIKRFNNELYPDHFLLIKEAYEYLSDPEKRRNYLIQLNLSSSQQHVNPRDVDQYRTPQTYIEENHGYPSLGWIIAIFGSFLFTPVLAIPLGLIVGMGFRRALKTVGTLIVIGIIILFVIALFS